jgi:UDP-3-O-[3-hydroxymyristoyl] glucosamine N-acyltransferase
LYYKHSTLTTPINMEFTTQQIADLLGGTVEGNPAAIIRTAAKIQDAQAGSIAFFANPKYESFLYTSEATAILVNKNFEPQKTISATLIRVNDAYIAFTKLLAEYQRLTTTPKKGIEQPSFVHPTAEIAQDVYIAAFAYIGEGAKIGAGAKVLPHAYIGDDAVIGEHTTIHAGAKVYPKTQIGKHCQIHAGAIIGSDGFGFAPLPDGSYEPIPQLGNVIIEDFVNIGANTTIDCATLGSTLIEEGAKLDNLIQIGHNVRIGAHTVMAALTGVSGSASVGKHCMIAGQVGVAGHIELADRTTVGAQSGITKSVKKEGTNIIGSPAMDYGTQIKNYIVGRNLVGLQRRVDELERKAKELS